MYRCKLNPRSMRLLQTIASVTVHGHVTISSANENVFAESVGYDTAFVKLDDGAFVELDDGVFVESDGDSTRIAAGGVSQIR
jgi:hypothetical protein